MKDKWNKAVALGFAVMKKISPKMYKKALSKGLIGTAIAGILGLVIIVQVYNQNSSNFTGLTGLVMGFFTVVIAMGLLLKFL